MALRALRHRDRTTDEIERLLESKGIGQNERQEVIETLVRTSLVDDARFAESRALALAERGAGNELIRHDLDRAGVDASTAAEAIAVLADETERASQIVARRGVSPKTARYLAGKGFSEDVIRNAVAWVQDEPLG